MSDATIVFKDCHLPQPQPDVEEFPGFQEFSRKFDGQSE